MEAALNRAVHSGAILADELGELGVPADELAREIGMPSSTMLALLDGRQPMTGDAALRLGHWFGTSPEFWINLQVRHDLVVAGRAAGEEISRLPRRAA